MRGLFTSRFIRQAVVLSVLCCLPVIGVAQSTLVFGTPSIAPAELRWGGDYTLSFLAISQEQPTQATTLTLHITENGISRRIDETPYGLANEFLPLQRQVSIPALGIRTSAMINARGTAGIGLVGTVAFRYCDDTQTLCTEAFNVDYLSDTPSRDINGNYRLSITTSTVVSGSCAAVREREQRIEMSQAGNTASYRFTDDFGLSAMLQAAISSNTYVFTRQYGTAPAFNGTRTLIVRAEFSDNDNGNGRAYWSYQRADGNLCRGTYEVQYSKRSGAIKVRARVFLEGALSGGISNIVSGATPPTLPERVQDTVLSESGALYALRDDHTLWTVNPSGSRQQLVSTSFKVGEVDIHDLVFVGRSDSTDRLYIVDSFLRAVIAVDLTDGSRNVVSGCDIANRCPSGQYRVGDGVPLTQPTDAVLDEAGNRLIITDTYLSALVAVDLTNGNRSVVSGCTANDLCPVEERNIGDGTVMLHPQALSINSSVTRIVVVDDRLDALLVVDATTGERVIVSGCLVRAICVIPERGSGPSFDQPIAVVLDDDAGLAYVADNGLRAVVEVDLDNGNRTVLLSPVTVRAPYHLILDADTERVLVYSDADGSLTAIPQAARTPTQLTTYIRTGSTATSPPAPPRDLILEARDDVIALSWRPVNRATSYKIYWNSFADINAAQADQVISDIYGTGYVHTGLIRGQLYYYAVSAVNEQGESAVSPAVSIMLPLPTGNDETPPTAPVIVSAYASSTTAIALDWMASTDDRSAAEQIVYEVHVSESTATTIGKDTERVMVQGIYSANVDDLKTSQTYYVHVAALDEAGNRSLSEMISIRTMSMMPKLSTQNEVVLIRIDTELNADGTIIVDRRDDLKVGQVAIMMGQDDSYLRRITRIEIVGSDQMLLYTEQASLADVFSDLSLNMNVRLEDVDDDAAIAAAKSAQVRAEQRGEPAPPADTKLRRFSPALRSPMSVPPSEVWPYQPIFEGGEQIREMHWPDSGFRLRQSEPLSQTDDLLDSIKDAVGLRSEQQPSEPDIPATYEHENIRIITTGFFGLFGDIIKVWYPPYVTAEVNKVASFDVYVEYPENFSERCSVTIDDITQRGTSRGRQGASVRAKPASADARIVEHRVRWRTYERHKSRDEWKMELLFGYPCERSITVPIAVSSDKPVNLSFQGEVTIPIPSIPDGEQRFHGDMDLDFDPEIKISYDRESSKHGTLEVVVGGDVDLDILLEIITASGYTLDGEKEIGKKKSFYRLIFVPTLGIPIPVVVNGELGFKVRGEAGVSAEMNIAQTFQSTYKLRAGFRYKNGRFVPISSADSSSEYEITVKTAAGMMVKFSLIPQLDLGLYASILTNVQLIPYVQGNGDVEGIFERGSGVSLEAAIDSSDYRFTRLDSSLGIASNINVDLEPILIPFAESYELFDLRRAITSLPEMQLRQGRNDENTYTVRVTPGQWFGRERNKIQQGMWSVVPPEGAPRLIRVDENTVRVDDSQEIEEDKYKLRYTGHSRYGRVIQQYQEIPIAVQLLGVCDRTPQVRDEIKQRVDKDDCAEISAEDLATITRMFLDEESIFPSLSSLLTGDFSGLTSLEWLDLGDNELSTLPEGIFSGLTSLGRLDLDGNELSTLPEGIFSGLTRLYELSLDNNKLSTLPEGIFSGLTRLEWLGLGDNNLSTLPEDIFSGLTRLYELRLDNNKLSTLPEDIFSGLTSLEYLYLYGNELSTLPEDIFSGLTSLQWLVLRNNNLGNDYCTALRNQLSLSRFSCD